MFQTAHGIRGLVCPAIALAVLATISARAFAGRQVLGQRLAASPVDAAVVPAFRFQNNFWVNLHHVLRGEARRRGVGAPPRVRLEELGANEPAAWTAALDIYTRYAGLDLVFDPVLIRLNNALTRAIDDSSLRGLPGLDAPTTRALTMAAPIYRAHYWPAQRQLNEHWIEGVRPLIAAHGAAMADALAKAYGVAWPNEPIVVDACAEAGPNGAYTTDGPPTTAAHTVIEAANPEYQGDMAFEMVFHEASHARAIEAPLGARIEAEAARQHAAVPPGLVHAIIFYTAGELARRTLGRSGDAHYLPYAYRYGVYTRGWQRLRDALEDDWQRYLDGAASLETAISALVRDMAAKD